MSTKTPSDVLSLISDHGIRMVDIRFIDLLGAWQHFTVPAHELDADAFEEGFGFDGSSVRGWKTINASDMLVIPDATTAIVDPFMEVPTLVIMGNVVDTPPCVPQSAAERLWALPSPGTAESDTPDKPPRKPETEGKFSTENLQSNHNSLHIDLSESAK